MPPSSDNILMQQCWLRFKKGDEKAFQELFVAYCDTMFHFGKNICADGDLVKDSIQDLFVELWNARERLADVQYPKHYLLISLRRLIFKKLRSNKIVSLENTSSLHYTADGLSVEDAIISAADEKQLEISIKEEVDNLPERQKEAIYLRYYQEMSYEEITEIMQLNYQVVRNLVYKALQNLRKSKLTDKLAVVVFALLLTNYLKVFANLF